jgi:hypothetical protein
VSEDHEDLEAVELRFKLSILAWLLFFYETFCGCLHKDQHAECHRELQCDGAQDRSES